MYRYIDTLCLLPYLHNRLEIGLSTILSGKLNADELQSAFLELVSLPITAELIAECVKVLRAKMVPVELMENVIHGEPVEPIDTCGTGGSGFKTINTSTLTSLIVATAGGKVAKHGNRSASGNCGCFDLLVHQLNAHEYGNILRLMMLAVVFWECA